MWKICVLYGRVYWCFSSIRTLFYVFSHTKIPSTLVKMRVDRREVGLKIFHSQKSHSSAWSYFTWLNERGAFVWLFESIADIMLHINFVHNCLIKFDFGNQIMRVEEFFFLLLLFHFYWTLLMVANKFFFLNYMLNTYILYNNDTVSY